MISPHISSALVTERQHRYRREATERRLAQVADGASSEGPVRSAKRASAAVPRPRVRAVSPRQAGGAIP